SSIAAQCRRRIDPARPPRRNVGRRNLFRCARLDERGALMISRRELLVGTPAAVLTTVIAARAAAQTPATQAPAATGPFTLPGLGYAVDALEPHIDAQTMTIHHDKHHQTYVTNLNNAIANFPDLKTRKIEDLVK